MFSGIDFDGCEQFLCGVVFQGSTNHCNPFGTDDYWFWSILPLIRCMDLAFACQYFRESSGKNFRYWMMKIILEGVGGES